MIKSLAALTSMALALLVYNLGYYVGQQQVIQPSSIIASLIAIFVFVVFLTSLISKGMK
jgi:4-amino-4-deoxy-L-arabinose transferase-like glycosyltransferase